VTGSFCGLRGINVTQIVTLGRLFMNIFPLLSSCMIMGIVFDVRTRETKACHSKPGAYVQKDRQVTT